VLALTVLAFERDSVKDGDDAEWEPNPNPNPKAEPGLLTEPETEPLRGSEPDEGESDMING